MKKALLILLCLSPLLSQAQTTNAGTEFWMGFMQNLSTSGHNLRLYISSAYNSKVYVIIPGQNYKDSIVVPKDSVKIVYIPVNVGQTAMYDSIDSRGIHIVSDFPVSISAMNLSAATTDASIVLPLVNIPVGATYVVGNPNPNQNQMLLVAASDSTIVQIDANAILNQNTRRPQSGAYTIRLDKGQSYIVSSSTNMSGSVVRTLSQKKLMVFSGDKCSNWPCGACDHQYEQVLPENVLDTAYCVAPHFGHTKGYYLKVIPLDTSTNIKVNGLTYNNVSRKQPLYINVNGDSGYYISSTKLFNCYQFLKGAGCNGYITGGYGDPAMLSPVSTKHFGQKVLFSTVNSTNLRDHFVSIVIKTSAKNAVYLDKSKIDSSEFKPFQYNKLYAYAMLKIIDGVHELECNDGLLAYCYGIGNYESYLYLAGFSLPNFDLDFEDSVLSYDCKNQKINMQFRAKSDKLLKKYTWTFGDGSFGSGNPVSHVYNSVGEYTVKLLGEDFGGKKDSITKKIKVNWPNFDPVRNKIICGNDTVKFEERNPFFSNFKWHDSSSLNYIKISQNTNVWVRATDTSGYCKFVDSGIVGKIDIFSNITVDTIDYCQNSNLFRFRDSTNILVDQIEHKAWVFPWKTIWDTSDTNVHFPSAGNYKVYFDIYTTQANCKARYPMDIVVRPSPKAIAKFKGDEFCANRPIFFYDSSQIKNGKIAKIKWDFDDNSSVISDSLKTYKTMNFDPVVIRFYKHIAISDYNCQDTALNAVKVWPKPNVNFTITTGDTIKCLPSARWTYTSTTTVATDSFDLKWDAGNGSKSTNFDMRNIRYFAPGLYPIKLVAISPYGCNDSITKHVEVIPIPKAVFFALDSEQCLTGNQFTFVDSSKGKGLIRNWSLDENKKDTGIKVQNIRYDSAGLKTIKLVISTNTSGCIDSLIRQINVLKMPQASFSVNKDTQCLNGNAFNFKNTSQFYQAYSRSNWSKTFVSIDTTLNLSGYSFNDTGNYLITLVVNDKKSCSDTVSKTVRVIPKPNANLILNDSVQCFNENKFIFKTSNNKQNQKSWYLDNTIVKSDFEDSLVWTLNNNLWHSMKLIVNTGSGCQDSISRKFKLLDKPNADFTINQDTQCFSSQGFNLENTSTVLGDKIKYTEFSSALGSYKNQDFVNGLSFPKTGDYTFKLKITTEENCSDSIIKSVFVSDEPVATIIGDSICPGQIAKIRGIQTKGGSILTWNWELGDGSTDQGQNIMHLYQDPGKYTLKLSLVDANKCVGMVESEAVWVYALPNAKFDYSATEFGINQMEVNFSPEIASYYKYDWQFPNSSKSTDVYPKLTINSQFKGNVVLVVKDQNGCEDSSSLFISLFPNNFNVYLPNAITVNGDLLNDVFIIEGIGDVLDYKLHILNRWGEEVYYTTDPKQGWDGSYEGSYVQEGVYSYFISFSYFNGKKYNFRGTITVLR